MLTLLIAFSCFLSSCTYIERFLDNIHLFFFNLCTESSTMRTQAGTLSASSKEMINVNSPLENRENQLIKIELSETSAREDCSLESSLHWVSYSKWISGKPQLYLNCLCIWPLLSENSYRRFFSPCLCTT